MLRMRRPDSTRERGSALVEFVTLGLMFLVPLIWIVMGVFEVQRGMYGVNSAAREAARAFVLAPNETEARARAQEAARVSLEDQDISLADEDVEVEPVCRDRNDNDTACLTSGSYVVVTVTYNVNLFFLPDYFDGIQPTYLTKAIQRTPYGDYRQSR